MLANDLVDKIQPHARARKRADIAAAIEPLTNPIDLVRWYAEATVPNRDLDGVAGGSRRQRDDTSFRRIFEGVRNQVAEGIMEELRIAANLFWQFADPLLKYAIDTHFAVVAREIT